MITLDEAKAYLRVDLADENDERMLKLAIGAANRWMISAIGIGYDEDDPKARQLELMVMGDLYDNRTTSEISEKNVRKLFNDISLQLRLELRDDIC
jgi:uncharacterized phage protein (predicted DNA packaging)